MGVVLTRRQVTLLRLAAVAALVVVALLVGRATGLGDLVSRSNLKATMASAGALAVPLYLGAFSLALLLHLPAGGIIFVAVAVTLYGRLEGGLLGYAGSLTGVLISYGVVRAVGGSPLSEIQHPFIRRVLAHLDERPIRTIALLRLLFFVSAPANYALALSAVRFRDYALGSTIGLIPPVVLLSFFFHLLIDAF